MSQDLPLPCLPQEIITIILSKLPVKSLLRFKCVSKPWLSLISSPQFTKLHLLQLKQNNSTISRVFLSNYQSLDPQTYSDGNGDHETAPFMEHNAINNVGDTYFVGSCDGLICAKNDYHLFVFNPTTQQVREIPTPNFTEKGLYFCGFGYDSNIDDYKIVRGVTFSFYYHRFCIEIFSLKGNLWRTIQTKDALLLKDSFDGEGVFLNGVLHWPTRNVIGIMRFDLVEERFLDKMSIPSGIDCMRGLIVIDECLCFYELNSRTFSAWKMMNYGDENSWTRVYQMGTGNFPEEVKGFLYVTKNGHLLFGIDTNYMILQNPVDDEIKQIGEEGGSDVYKIVYIESLVSPNITN